MALKLTKGNRNDSKESLPLLRGLEGLAFGDKGYISQSLFDTLFAEGLKLII